MTTWTPIKLPEPGSPEEFDTSRECEICGAAVGEFCKDECDPYYDAESEGR